MSSTSKSAPKKSAPKKGKEKADLKALPASEMPISDSDELEHDRADLREDAEEREDEESHSSASGGDAALAAAGSGEVSASFKNFRHQPDMENFYRFIFENDLRHEALAIVDEVMREKASKRAQLRSSGTP